MCDGQIGSLKAQPGPPARGTDRCERCRARHVKCDGTRPTCNRCQRRREACIYTPKKTTWTVYTNDSNESSRNQHSSLISPNPKTVASSMHEHPEFVFERTSDIPATSTLSSERYHPALPYMHARGIETFTCQQLPLSLDSLPGRGKWSDIRADVHGLMDNFFQIDARYVPSTYFNEIVSSADLTVSYTSLPALYQSIVTRRFETDPAVLNVRGSVLRSINKALRKRDSQLDDSTIISIKHQLYYDCFIASKPVILAHLKGLYQILRMRGGLHTLGLAGDLAHMLKLHTLMAYIITEHPPPSDYLTYKTCCSPAVEEITPVNLAYCPFFEPFDITAPINEIDPPVEEALHQLRRLLQQLTDYFLTPGSQSEERIRQLYCQILESPVRCGLPHESSAVWIYEACRLSATVFAAAIKYHTPLSSAVDRAIQDTDNQSLLEDLCKSIFRSPYSSQPFWGSWAGFFLWVSLVAASLSQYGVDILDPQDNLYFSAKLRRTSLVVALSFATKLFHAQETSEQAFKIMETMILVQRKLAAGCNDVAAG